MMDAPDIWALFDHEHAPTYYKGRVAILGDAAHASTPHQGAGAGQAIEDAFILSSLLGDEKTQSASNIPAAFKAYDAIRRPRSQKVVATSRAAGLTYAFQGPAQDNLEKIGEELLKRYQWIWDEDMEKQAERAKSLLKGDKRTKVRTCMVVPLMWMAGLWKNLVQAFLSRVVMFCRRFLRVVKARHAWLFMILAGRYI